MGGVLPPSGAGFCEADCRRKKHSSIQVKHTSLSIITIQSRFLPQKHTLSHQCYNGSPTTHPVQPGGAHSPLSQSVEHPVQYVVYLVALIPPVLIMINRGQPLNPGKFKTPPTHSFSACAQSGRSAPLQRSETHHVKLERG